MLVSSTNIEAGHDALATGVALLDRSHMGRVVATGADAFDLINRFSTNETVGLADGDVVVTILTSDAGRVKELLTIVRRAATESIILTGTGAENSVTGWLDKYNFGEDCGFTVTTESSAQITISGPKAVDLGVPLPEPDRMIAAEIGGVPVEIAHVPGPSLPSYEVLVDQGERAGDVWDALLAAGGMPSSEDAFDVLRVERGLPARVRELTDDANPLEAGLEAYVSFSKGCYMGQEVIARLDTYEKVQRQLVGLMSESGAELSVDSALKAGEREIGRITSTVVSRSLGREIALAYVRKAHAKPGTMLEGVNGPVVVVELPFSAV